MRKVTLVLFVAFASFFSTTALAQQDWKFNQYALNGMGFNPAYTGLGTNISATALYRNQYLGLADFNPNSRNFNIHSKVNKVKGGLGLNILDDSYGLEKFTGVYLSYAYHKDNVLPIEGTLSGGISIGLLQITSELSKLNPKTNPDPILVTSDISGFGIDVNAGMLFTSTNYYVGISATHLTNPKIDLQNNATVDMQPHFFITGGYTYKLNEKINLLPSVLIKSIVKKTQFDFSAMGMYNSKYWGGLGYSTSDAIYLLAGGYLKGNQSDGGLKLGLSYGATMNKLGSIGGRNTVEAMLGYNFKIQIPVKIPPTDPIFH